MTAAIMQCDQARPGPPSLGSPGIARNDLWQSRTCTFTSINAAGAYQWSVLDKPPGSLASFDTPTAQSANITFDKAGIDGTYRIMLSLDGGGPNSGTGTYQILVFRVRSDVNGVQVDRGWAMPAVGEQLLEGNYGGNARGYDEPFRFMMKDILSFMVSGGSATAGGDLSGVVANATVQKIQNRAVSASPPNDEDVMTWVAANTRWEPKAITLPNLGGDTTGPPGANTTMRIRGAAVASAAGALVLGAVLRVVGGSALDYGPVDLSNASAVANQLAGSYVVPAFGAQAISGASLNTTGDVTVGGNLIVNGTTVTVNSTTLDVDARIVHANSHAIATVPVPTLIAGLEVERGDNGATKRDAAGVLWNESSSEWTFAYQTAANDTALGTFLQIKALGGTFTSLGSGGSGYASVNNSGTLGFVSAATLAGALTLIGDVNGAANANHVDTLTGTAGAVTQASATTIKWTQDGTISTPTTRTIMSWQPRDPAVAPYTMRIEASLFNSTVDYRWGIGYNTKRDNTSEPALYWHVESNYEASPGVHFVETYWQWDNGVDSYRPIELLINRTTSQAVLQLSAGKTATDTIDFLNFAGSTLIAQFGTASGINIGQLTIARNDLASTFAVQAGSNASIVSTAGYVQLYSATTTFIDGSGDVRFRPNGGTLAGGFDGTTFHVNNGAVVVASVEYSHGRASFGGAGSDYKVAFGPDPGAPTAAATLHMLAPATTPSGSNYVLLSDGNITALNAVGSTLEFQIGTGSVWWLQGSTLINWMTSNFEWTESLTPLLYSDVAASDHPAHDFTIRAQYPYSLATLANRKPANIVFDIGVPTSGGTTEGYFSFTRNTSEIARVAAHPTTNSQIAFWLGSASFLAGQSNAVLLSDGSSYTYLNTKALGALGLVIDDASFLMYMPGQANIAFWFASTVSNAPFYFDVGGANGSATTPFISSGNAATAFTMGTTKAGAALNLSADANLLNIGLSKSAVATNKVDFYSPNGTSQLNLTVTDGSIVSLATIPTAFFSITAGPYAELLFNTNQSTLFANTQLFENYSASEVYMQLSTGFATFNGTGATAPLAISWLTGTTPTIKSGTAATSLTVGTTKASATLILQADAASTVATLSKVSSTSSSIVFSSPGLASAATINVNDNGAAYFGAGTLSTNYILFNGTAQSYVVSSGGNHVFADNAAVTFATLSVGGGLVLKGNATTPFVRGDTTSTSLTVGTNKASASLIFQADLATTLATATGTGWTIGVAAGTNQFVGAFRGTHRDSAANFTFDTTTTDWQTRLTATQTANLPTQTTGRWMPLILDATGVAVGTNMVITIHPPNTVKINNSTNDLVINVPGGEVQGWSVRGDSSGNWWIYPGG